MHLIDGLGHVSHDFTEGDPGTGAPATQITAAWLTAIQREIANVVTGSGASLTKADNTQLVTAINSLISTAVAAGVAGVSLAHYVTTQTANYAPLFSNGFHQVVLCNTNAFTVTLPTAVGNAGKTITVVKIGSDSNAITIATTSAQTLSGEASGDIKLYKQHDRIKLESDGANWVIVEEAITIYCRAYMTGDQTVNSGVQTKAALNTSTEDSATAFTNASSLYTAPRPGRYRITGNVTVDAPNGSTCNVQLQINSVVKGERNWRSYYGSSMQVSETLRLAKGDVVTLHGLHTRGSDTTFTGGSSYTNLSLSREGR